MQIEVVFPGNKKVDARIREFTVKTDQPVQSGGDNTAPSPYDLFLASIGTCAGIFVKGFCLQRNISTDGIRLIEEVIPGQEHGTLSKVRIDVQVPPDFPEKYKEALIATVNLCSVKKTMQKPPQFETVVTVKET